MTALIKAVFNLLIEMPGHVPVWLWVKHQGIAWQVIEQGSRFVKKQWKVVLYASRHQAFADIPVDQAALRIAGEGFAVVLPETCNGLLIGGKLTCRQHLNGFDFFQRALGFGVKGAQTVDFIVKQVNSVRHFAAHGENVEQ